METWKDVPGWEGKYQVSDFGRIRNKSKVMKPLRHTGGYQRICFWRKGKYFQTYVHKVVLEAFVGQRPEGFQACHANGDRQDNRLSNLRWDSPSENQTDRVFHGTSYFGKKRPIRNLTKDEVIEIKKVLIDNDFNRTKTAKTLGLSRTTVNDIALGRTWRNV